MIESVVLSSYFLGSVYLFGKSLEIINRKNSEGEMPEKLIALNGLTFVMTGTIVVYSYSLLYSQYLKK